MFKKIILGMIILFFSFDAFSENIFESFLAIYNSCFDEDYLFYQKLEEFNSNKELLSSTLAKSLCHGDKEFSEIQQKNGNLYFLSTNNGYWIKNIKLKQPMKISGSYKVMDIQMQDLLRLDFAKDFEIIDSDENSVLLKRVNKKISYSYIKICRTGKNYTAEVFDSNFNTIKTITYETGKIDEKDFFTKIVIFDNFLTDGIYYEYSTTDSKKVKILTSLFSSNHMDELITFIGNL